MSTPMLHPANLPSCTSWEGSGIHGYVQHQVFGLPFEFAFGSRGESRFTVNAMLTAADARTLAAQLIAHADAWDALYGPETPALTVVEGGAA